jgi:hypothetical protein
MAPTLKFTEFGSGLSWSIKESGARSSHALLADGQVWLIDPVDSGDAIERALGLGKIAGVLQLLDRHNRDCAPLADRLGVPHHKLPTHVDDSPFEFFSVLDRPKWHEVGLWWEAGKVLAVAESVGTAPGFAVGDAPVGIHPLLRLLPARAPGEYSAAEHLLCGHGVPLHTPNAGADVKHAIERSRRDIPKLLIEVPGMIKGMRR